MNNQIKIFFSEDSDIVELEMLQRGWRGDIVIEFENQTFTVEFITLERLKNEYQYTTQEGQIYFIHNTTIIVDSVNKKTIIETILNLYQNNCLFNFSKVDLKDKYKTAFSELQDLKNWTQIY